MRTMSGHHLIRFEFRTALFRSVVTHGNPTITRFRAIRRKAVHMGSGEPSNTGILFIGSTGSVLQAEQWLSLFSLNRQRDRRSSGGWRLVHLVPLYGHANKLHSTGNKEHGRSELATKGRWDYVRGSIVRGNRDINTVALNR